MSSKQPKKLSTVPRTTHSTSTGKKNDDQLFEFLNSGPGSDGDKKRISNQLRSSSPVQTSSPKMPKLNNAVQHEQNKKDKLPTSGTGKGR